MQIETIGPNQTKIITNTGCIFFSYNTPVAARIDGKYYRTEERFSNTTSKHINKFLNGREAELRPQSFFTGLN